MDPATRIYSCDDHLDLPAVPTDLWTARLSGDLAERAPHVEDRKGDRVWVVEDRVIGRSATPAGNISAISRAGIEDDGFRASDPHKRLQDMDTDGLWASVIYGPLALGLPIQDPALQSACYAAWNDWAVEEFNSVDPGRLCILGFVPGHSPEAAAQELERCAARGHRGAIIDVFDIDVADRKWDTLWRAVEETGLPLSFHLKGGASRLSYQTGSWKAPAFATVAPMQLDEPLAAAMFSGIFERHPRMKLVLAESGIGWLPYFVHRMDHEWHTYRGKVDYELETAPSEIFKRQIWATFEEEPLGTSLIPLLGADSFMWASDYPHPDSTFPHSAKAIEEAMGTLPEADRRKVTATNCAQLYRLP